MVQPRHSICHRERAHRGRVGCGFACQHLAPGRQRCPSYQPGTPPGGPIFQDLSTPGLSIAILKSQLPLQQFSRFLSFSHEFSAFLTFSHLFSRFLTISRSFSLVLVTDFSRLRFPHSPECGPQPAPCFQAKSNPIKVPPSNMITDIKRLHLFRAVLMSPSETPRTAFATASSSASGPLTWIVRCT